MVGLGPGWFVVMCRGGHGRASCFMVRLGMLMLGGHGREGQALVGVECRGFARRSWSVAERRGAVSHGLVVCGGRVTVCRALVGLGVTGRSKKQEEAF